MQPWLIGFTMYFQMTSNVKSMHLLRKSCKYKQNILFKSLLNQIFSSIISTYIWDLLLALHFKTLYITCILFCAPNLNFPLVNIRSLTHAYQSCTWWTFPPLYIMGHLVRTQSSNPCEQNTNINYYRVPITHYGNVWKDHIKINE